MAPERWLRDGWGGVVGRSLVGWWLAVHATPAMRRTIGHRPDQAEATPSPGSRPMSFTLLEVRLKAEGLDLRRTRRRCPRGCGRR